MERGLVDGIKINYKFRKNGSKPHKNTEKELRSEQTMGGSAATTPWPGTKTLCIDEEGDRLQIYHKYRSVRVGIFLMGRSGIQNWTLSLLMADTKCPVNFL